MIHVCIALTCFAFPASLHCIYTSPGIACLHRLHCIPVHAWHADARAIVKELEAYQEPLKKLQVKLKVTAAQTSKYAVFTEDLDKAVSDLDNFVKDSLNSIYEFEALPAEQASSHNTLRCAFAFASAIACMHIFYIMMMILCTGAGGRLEASARWF